MNSKTRMPSIFIGHGNPMNAIEINDYTKSLSKLGNILPKPRAILAISAHWETTGTWVTGMENPKTIHDFGGFPKELFEVQYPAPGEPELAEKIVESISEQAIQIEMTRWGLDHGTWAVLKHIFPKADIPVVQLSLDKTQDLKFHFELGEKLKFLRDEGVLILGSGNIVHNLRKVNWEKDALPYDWAIKFDQWVKSKIDNRDFQPLIHEVLNTDEGRLSIPTLDHYLPLLYTLGASDINDELFYDYEAIEMSSMSMRSLRFK